jgi:hypothetical protein
MRCLPDALSARGEGTHVVRDSRRHRKIRLASVATSLVVAVPLLTACGASSNGGGGAATAKAPAALCSKILAVLSDGPDPDADPVGYALSQVDPLGDIHSSDHAVQTTLTTLIAADKALVSAKGADHAAKATITRADKSLNVACPGVAP